VTDDEVQHQILDTECLSNQTVLRGYMKSWENVGRQKIGEDKHFKN